MAVHNINWLLSRLPSDQKTYAEGLYRDNISTLKLLGFENNESITKTAAVMTQSQLNGTLDSNIVDVERLEMAKRTQNFFEKYDRKALDNYLNGKISYQQLKKRIERIKKTDERYLKSYYSKR